jgi:hypothetical protein
MRGVDSICATVAALRDPDDAPVARLPNEDFFAGDFADVTGVTSAAARLGFDDDALLRVLPFWSTL